MKTLIASAALLFAISTLSLRAEDTKIVGEATCGKCTLKKTDSCQTAIVINNTDGTKETIFATDNKISSDFHKEICKSTKKVEATGEIKKNADGSKTITLTSIYLVK